MVCRTCGVGVANSKARGWIHTDMLPRGVEAHDAVPVDETMWEAARGYDAMAAQITEARDWASHKREVMQREEMEGVKWTDEVRHTVMLLNALEAAEAITVQALADAAEWRQKFMDAMGVHDRPAQMPIVDARSKGTREHNL